ncbi:MAG: DUF2469 family protein [Euzebya sp.]
MGIEELDGYESEMELALYHEYRDIVAMFTWVVETERRFYLANDVDVNPVNVEGGDVWFDVRLSDAWVWDMYRPARFVSEVRIMTFRDVNIERISHPETATTPESLT